MPPPLPVSNPIAEEFVDAPSWARPCPDCGQHIAAGAESCPHCGSAELHARRKAGPCSKCKGPMYFAGREMRGHFDGGGVLTALLGLFLIVWAFAADMAVIVGAPLVGLGVVSLGIGGLGLTVGRVNRYEVLWFTCRPCKANKSVKR